MTSEQAREQSLEEKTPELKPTIFNVLAYVQQTLKAPKGQFNKFGNYNYRSCEDIIEAVKPLLAEYGAILLLSDSIEYVGDRYYIKARAAVHFNGAGVESCGYARETDKRKGMDESQITGAASSYARKYALNGLFAIDDNKDADQASKKQTIVDDPVDEKKLNLAAAFFKNEIDKDNWDNVDEIKREFAKLNQSEKMALGNLLNEKAPDSNRLYKTLLKDYLHYVPEEGVAK